MHEPVWRVQLVVFEKITGAYLHQIAREIMLLLIDNLHEKASQKVKTDEILTARALTDAHPKDLSSMALGTRYTFYIL